ncbi:hypothetical protein EZV62_006453 [Acer yangbiense]|uniref:F-box domain-containing protein n=1 Tax=Acer yangbiense TaxID=1000413 RepID=A0A5C7I7Z1_9ROSI|nr:hypothetical protein EZV62_006453 [Acer yangbiense]
MSLDFLPEDCFAHILSFTSPSDACRLSLVSSMARSAADSDNVWEKFLPSDYQEILSRLVWKVVYSSKKDLFFRFAEVVELRTITWLEIHGKINTRMISAKTVYGAYLIVKFADRAYGLDSLPSEVSLEVGDVKVQGTVYLLCQENKKQDLDRMYFLNRVQALRSRVSRGGEGKRVVSEREDGWFEIELGSFYNVGGDYDNNNKEVKMCLKEVKGEHLKGGLIVEGIEIRPKH